MTRTPSDTWRAAVGTLDFALQPIVNIHSGAVYGFEALLRGVERRSYPSIAAFFDAAWNEGVLYPLDCLLREKAFRIFRDLPCRQGAKLFYNLDNRVTEAADYAPGNTQRLLESLSLDPASLVFEISERHEFRDYPAARSVLERYKVQNFRIAVDDFGAGYAGLQLLYFAQPDLIKIDRFFVAGIDRDARKRQFAERIIDMAHLMGIHVVAEGVETEAEFHACRKIGCDLVQGYLIARPELDRSRLRDRYPLVGELARSERRGGAAHSPLRARLDPVPPIGLGEGLMAALERFKGGNGGGKTPATIPVVDESRSCVGVLRERDFRPYVYSPFGIALLSHAATSAPFGGLLVPVPVADVEADLRAIQSLFIGSPETEGVVVAENGRYAGFLDARSILEAVAERELSDARDQNPLSRLPGNARLDEYLSLRWDDAAADCLFCYFDFDHFKPFNDRYGFRRGDRVIQLFADILRDVAGRSLWFAAHIGGDDFFAGIDCSVPGAELEAERLIAQIAERFAGSVAAFYDEDDRRRGYIEEKDRAGTVRRFPLLTVTAARYRKRIGPAAVPFESAGELFATLKKESKRRKAGAFSAADCGDPAVAI